MLLLGRNLVRVSRGPWEGWTMANTEIHNLGEMKVPPLREICPSPLIVEGRNTGHVEEHTKPKKAAETAKRRG